MKSQWVCSLRFRRVAIFAALVMVLGIGKSADGGEAGWVAQINGTPTVTRGGKSEPLKRGDTIAIGDVVATDDTAKVKVLLADDSVLTIGPRTQVTVDELLVGPDGRKGRVRVLFGRFKMAIVAWLTGPSDYEVKTPTAVAGVRGTILWGDTELDTICALQGHVEVRTLKSDAVASLETGHCATQMGRGETAPLVPSPAELQKYLKEVSLD